MANSRNNNKWLALAGLLFIGLTAWGLISVTSFAWTKFASLDTKVAIGIISASTTVIVAALTVTLGRYLERKKEIEAHFRERKVEIYDEFLKEFFKLFSNESNEKPDQNDLVAFLKEWQRKMILWGGSDVLAKYLKWKRNLEKGTPNAESLYLTDDFFKSIRSDLGLSNRGLRKGFFIHFILKHTDLFMEASKENPNITLAELEILENQLESNLKTNKNINPTS